MWRKSCFSSFDKTTQLAGEVRWLRGLGNYETDHPFSRASRPGSVSRRNSILAFRLLAKRQDGPRDIHTSPFLAGICKAYSTRFGRSYTDRGLALLRKATTVSQWVVLPPELSGIRSDTHYRDAVRFLLENPFSHRELRELPIEHVLGWLSYERLSTFMSDSHNTARLSAVIAVKLIEPLDMEVQEVIDWIPPRNTLTTFTGSDDRVKRCSIGPGCQALSCSSSEVQKGRESAQRHTIATMLPSWLTLVRQWRTGGKVSRLASGTALSMVKLRKYS